MLTILVGMVLTVIGMVSLLVTALSPPAGSYRERVRRLAIGLGLVVVGVGIQMHILTNS